jgi:hypothetical protein
MNGLASPDKIPTFLVGLSSCAIREAKSGALGLFLLIEPIISAAPALFLCVCENSNTRGVGGRFANLFRPLRNMRGN